MEERVPAHVEVASGMRPGRWLDYHVYPAADGVSVFFRDITERIAADQALEEARGLIQASLDALSAHVALVAGDGTIVSVNAGWKRFADANALRMARYGVGVNYLDVCRGAAEDSDASLVCSGLEALLGGAGDDQFRHVYVCGNRWFQMSAARFSFDGKIHAVVAHEDVTEVRTAQNAVSELSQHLLASQEEERRRIAAELHDSTAQHLVSVNLNLMRLEIGTSEAAGEIRQEIETSLDEALKEIRVFTYLLHPPGLHSDGLGPTLRRFVEGFARRAGLEVSFHASPVLGILTDDLQRSVLRVVQEGLSNAHRHASARRVAVNAKLIRGTLFVRVEDDGRGMPEGINHAGVEDARLGVGIPGMRARLRQFGGDLTIRSRPGRTTLIAAVPLAKAV
jgi:signal transduction histidine kinase